MPTEITVRGTFSTFQAPERATVHASIAFEGPSMEPVYDRVARDLESVKETVTPMQTGDHGAVTWWSAEQLRTWSNRPWNKDGIQLPMVHHASVGLEVKFRDFASLSRWVGTHVANTEGFRVSSIEWALTDDRRAELQRHARISAVEDAVRKATDYAEAAGLGPIRPVAIADAGMLGEGLHPQSGGGPSYMRVAGALDGAPAPVVELVPEDIEVAAAVDARFLADDGVRTA
jgi:uncharacterized protein YggE